eukprot:m.19263 g.19263  ORF g.19263 m.19263 type:complete len:919 (+) comp5420_c0_seq1:486-3242(+)
MLSGGDGDSEATETEPRRCFVATAAADPEHAGFGRCTAMVEVWAAAGVTWWGQPALVAIESLSTRSTNVSTMGAPEDGGVSGDASATRPPGVAVWCTAWPTPPGVANAQPTIDLGLIADAATLPDSPSSAWPVPPGEAVRCTVLRVATHDPVPLETLTLALSRRGQPAPTTPAIVRALIGKPIVLGSSVAVGGFRFGSESGRPRTPTWINVVAAVPSLRPPPPDRATTAVTECSGVANSTEMVGMLGQVTARTEIRFAAAMTESEAGRDRGGDDACLGEESVAPQVKRLPPCVTLPPGLETPFRELEALVSLPLLHPRVFATLSVECPKGVLLHGPPGTGKTLLAQTVAQHTGATLVAVDGPELFAPYLGESEANLRRVFDSARAATATAAVVLFIDEIEALCPRRTLEQSHESRVVAQLLTLMDGIEARGRLVVLAATNRPNALDPALRRPGRFDREIEVKAPTAPERAQILRYCTRTLRAGPELDYERLGAATPGFVGADLAALCRDAVLAAVRRADAALPSAVGSDRSGDAAAGMLAAADRHSAGVSPSEGGDDAATTARALDPNIGAGEGGDTQVANTDGGNLAGGADSDAGRTLVGVRGCRAGDASAETSGGDKGGQLRDDGPTGITTTTKSIPAPPSLVLETGDFTEALRRFVPSTRREGRVAVTPTRWEDIGGLETVKAQLEQAVLWPLLYPQTYARLGVTPPRGILLHGPPGNAKTTLARALASHGHSAFFALSGAEIFSPFVGDAEKTIRDVFKKARLAAPAVIFLDEIDAVVGSRGGSSDSGGVQQRTLATLLTEMDGVATVGQVLVVGATNRPDMIDSAFIRAGRIDHKIHVPPPDLAARLSILQVKTRAMPLAPSVDLAVVAAATEGRSGAELENVCREAALLALRGSIDADEVSMEHFEVAMCRK